MKRFATLLVMTLPLCAQDYKIAIIGMVHSHVWGHFKPMLDGKDAKLVGIAETTPELVSEALKRGAITIPFFDDYKKVLDQKKPDIVWAFVENNRHLEIVEACAPRKVAGQLHRQSASRFRRPGPGVEAARHCGARRAGLDRHR